MALLRMQIRVCSVHHVHAMLNRSEDLFWSWGGMTAVVVMVVGRKVEGKEVYQSVDDGEKTREY